MTKEERAARKEFDSATDHARTAIFNARRTLSRSGLKPEILHLNRELLTEAVRLVEIATTFV